MSRRTSFWLLIALIVGLTIFARLGSLFYTDWLWFRGLGFAGVFSKTISSQLIVGLLAGVLFALLLGANLWIARPSRFELPFTILTNGEEIRIDPRQVAPLLIAASVVLGAVVGWYSAGSWLAIEQFRRGATFGVTDPIFGRDVGFFVFKLPFYGLVYQYVMSILILSILAAAFLYLFSGGVGTDFRRIGVSGRAALHLSLLMAAAFALKASGYWLQSFKLVYSPRGVVFGAGYSDIHAQLPALKLLMVVAGLCALAALANVRLRRTSLFWALPVGLAAVSVLAGTIYPTLVQQFSVRPNELAREREFIVKNIEFTRKAFGLERIAEKEFAALDSLTVKDMDDNRATIENIRVWDWRPLKRTYSQLQAIRPYYNFNDVDIDRYKVGGRLRQVMLSAREMDHSQLPDQGKTWINQALKYTHGYGLVVSPATEVNSEGLPYFWIKDIPPKAETELKVTRPEIYYGESDDDYVIVKAREKEFDYPLGDKNAETTYQGKGGVPIGSFLNRLAFSLRFENYNLILSNYITSESRVMFYRNIHDQVRRIAPFLSYDGDPYLVISDGRLIWVQDAYTTTDAYPYSEPFAPRNDAEARQAREPFWGQSAFNYVRNSVKVTIDAYDGTVNFYLFDPADPLARTYSAIFPGLFKPASEMPQEVRDHLRYPEDLFGVQARQYTSYHMLDPEVFYNKEDYWNIAEESQTLSAGDGRRGTYKKNLPIPPYYVIMKLPGEREAEFILMVPFTPNTKPNMISWLAARNDAGNYGQLIVYKLPKQQLIYGPMQVEGRIDQDAEISQKLTLWGQAGSEVIRGNLLVIPVKESILYVEPLYLQATNNKLPELKRVIVAYGNQVVMEETLPRALERIFGRQEAGAGSGSGTGAGTGPGSTDGSGSTAPAFGGGSGNAGAPGTGGTSRNRDSLITEANRIFTEAQVAVQKGDWTTYGQKMKELGETLRRLQESR